MNQENIRNFVIIAHIDHGKSTLADRMLEITGTVAHEKLKPQMLDTMDLERERGITIKLQPVTMIWRPNHEILNPKSEILNKSPLPEARHSIQNSKNSNSLDIRNSDLKIANSEYILNLIDTPGHVDFSYEVSRSLAAVEGAILLVDATKGIQAQTLANLHLACRQTGIAQEHNLKIIPVINKIDLPGARIEETKEEIAKLLNIDEKAILLISAKTGEGVENLLQEIINRVPAPKGERVCDFKALIFDSVYDEFRGAIAYVRVFEGEVKKGDKIKFLGTSNTETATEVGSFRLKYEPCEFLKVGEIGYVVTGERELKNIKVGDTITGDSPVSVSPILGFKIPKSFVFASFYIQGGDPQLLRQSLEKLSLNDSSLNFTPESSKSFGQGFRCGFLGLLHLEIVKERLEREYGLNLIVTQPQVAYRLKLTPNNYEEPWVRLEIITPQEYVGPVMELVQSRRAIYKNTNYLGDRTILEYEVPLAEIIVDFYDKLKSVSSGYASQNYEFIGYRPGDLVKLDVLIAGDKVEEFSRVIPRHKMMSEAKNLVLKLKELIPRQMFEVSIQAAVNNKILAREDIPAMRKDVIAKLYGGDVTRKNKLLKKQAAGKKKMKQLGKVQIPDDVFLKMLQR